MTLHTMTTEPFDDGSLRVEVAAGPPLDLPPLQPGGSYSIGRSESCEIPLVEETVSRRHALIAQRGERWLITDLASRQGTHVNGVRLQPNQPVAMVDGDLLKIGPWTFRVNLGRSTSTHTATIDDSSVRTRRVERVSGDHTTRLATHRLNLLIECAAAITSAADESALATAVLRSAIEGTGFQRASMLRAHGGFEELTVIGTWSRQGETDVHMAYSRTLLREAAGGQMARLSAQDSIVSYHSIVEQGVTAALCAPIMLGSAVDAYLYLDARGGPSVLADDAAGFCQVIARLCGLAMANMKRRDMEARQRMLEGEVSAAREAQQFIVPPESGTIGALRYAMRMRPGRDVGGDLFDVIDLTAPGASERRIAVVIGDVTGFGAGAAMLMVAAQSHLHGALRTHGDPAAAVTIVNQYLTQRGQFTKFISLWVGVFDLTRSELFYVDAGHGHWLHKPTNDANGTNVVPHRGGVPVGIDPLLIYQAERLALNPGDRIILYSDGVVEQRGPDDPEQFGRQRVIELVNNSSDAEMDVASVLMAVQQFARGDELADDTTVASVEWAFEGR